MELGIMGDSVLHKGLYEDGSPLIHLPPPLMRKHRLQCESSAFNAQTAPSLPQHAQTVHAVMVESC